MMDKLHHRHYHNRNIEEMFPGDFNCIVMSSAVSNLQPYISVLTVIKGLNNYEVSHLTLHEHKH